MSVIAMTREMGSRGKDVAAGAAAALGLTVVHHELVERPVAERMGLPESAVRRFLEGEASLWERWKVDGSRIAQYSAEEILDLAAKGNVIIRGWGAAQLLENVPGIVCVRVCAPLPRRVSEMMERLGLADEDAARREIERNDAAHDRLVRSRFDRDWRDPADYDLVLNTGRMPVETGIGILVDYVRFVEKTSAGQRQATLADELIGARVRSALAEAGISDFAGAQLRIAVSGGGVRITGMIPAGRDADELAAIVGTIEGVTGVETDLGEFLPNYMPYGP